MAKLNWEKAKQKDRVRKSGTVPVTAGMGKKKKRKRKAKKVHPNSTAATKWGKTTWRRRKS